MAAKAILALLASGTAVNALLIPPSISLNSILGPSSDRPSLNFGPDLAHSRYHHQGSFHPSLVPYTSSDDLLQAQHSYEPSLSSALDVAHKVVKDLHPSAHYHISSKYHSKHNDVLHVHFRQVVPLADGDLGAAAVDGEETWIPVTDGLINVNIDVGSGRVISFGDSFWKGHQIADCSSSLDNGPQFQDSAEQVVFGSQDSIRCSIRDSASSPHSLLSPLIDPRRSLLSFLSLAYNHLAHFSPAHHDKHLDSIYIAHSFVAPGSQDVVYGPRTTSNSVVGIRGQAMKLHDAPGAEEPVSAELAFVQRELKEGEERKLDLVWRLEYRSRDNWYEAYVDAVTPEGSQAGPEVRHVVDYVKDWRPTSAAEGFESTKEWLPMWVKSDEALSESLELLGKETEAEITIVSTSITRSSSAIISSLRSILADLLPSSSKPSSGNPKPPSHPSPYPAPGTNGTRGPFYRIFPWGTNDPSEGHRELVARPGDRVASPQGWHIIPPSTSQSSSRPPADISAPGWSDLTDRGMRFHDTRSNNVFAQENWEGADRWETNFRPSGLVDTTSRNKTWFNTSELVFDFKLGWGDRKEREGKEIDPKSYVNVSITELFFTCNEIHDLYYRYGFDEQSGNFQEYNGDKGGRGGDAVIANSQDGSGYNNANFATPPDGRRGRMRMYVWNGDLPWRDGDLESGIVIHEYSHGLSTRLTGGPANSGCLGWGEAGGMGEGWGDFLATMIRMHGANPKDFSMGEWASGSKGGIRRYKYSMNMTTNPETYKYLDKPGYWGVHAIGAVWAEMLYVVGELLIADHGFNPTLFPPIPDPSTGLLDAAETFYTTSSKTGKRVPKHGNTLWVQLVLDGMKLQPCRPNFMNARDAILQADEVLTGGENKCTIWKGFAQRGLGPDASIKGSTPWGGGVRTEDYDLPRECGKKGKKVAAWL